MSTDNPFDTEYKPPPAIIKPPRTPTEFKPPRPRSLTEEMAALLRNEEHWNDVLPYIDALCGLTKSIHGSARYDEAGCIFKVQELCDRNGYTLLAKLPAAQVSPIFKRALKFVTGLSMRVLTKQGRQLRLEFKDEAND